ncbi:hypothetical protein GCM10007320_58530 [Pseudorhodoferax aquiterrae]|uniref:Uncharacterized protein n=1 Tax=Pseudorhodoferax aquiterrae TaxID=747304 RepID=A0ABQ3GBJ3_9BURK|nr:hypothetical protein GCM10007320_58530 [Pseudorhodoferax aquiterrae]
MGSAGPGVRRSQGIGKLAIGAASRSEAGRGAQRAGPVRRIGKLPRGEGSDFSVHGRRRRPLARKTLAAKAWRRLRRRPQRPRRLFA